MSLETRLLFSCFLQRGAGVFFLVHLMIVVIFANLFKFVGGEGFSYELNMFFRVICAVERLVFV